MLVVSYLSETPVDYVPGCPTFVLCTIALNFRMDHSKGAKLHRISGVLHHDDKQTRLFLIADTKFHSTLGTSLVNA